MRVTHLLRGALAAALLITSTAGATPLLLEGTAITAQPTSLLGYDAAANDYIAGGVSALSDANIEFLTADFALALDFGSAGSLRLWDNTGTGENLFNYTLRFSLAGLAGPLASLQLREASSLRGGDVSFDILTGNTFELALRDVRFAPGFTFADVAITVAEPPVLALLGLGMLGMLAATLRRAPRQVAQ